MCETQRERERKRENSQLQVQGKEIDLAVNHKISVRIPDKVTWCCFRFSLSTGTAEGAAFPVGTIPTCLHLCIWVNWSNVNEVYHQWVPGDQLSLSHLVVLGSL